MYIFRLEGLKGTFLEEDGRGLVLLRTEYSPLLISAGLNAGA